VLLYGWLTPPLSFCPPAGPQREPRGVRHHQQAAQHHRVGVGRAAAGSGGVQAARQQGSWCWSSSELCWEEEVQGGGLLGSSVLLQGGGEQLGDRWLHKLCCAGAHTLGCCVVGRWCWRGCMSKDTSQGPGGVLLSVWGVGRPGPGGKPCQTCVLPLAVPSVPLGRTAVLAALDCSAAQAVVYDTDPAAVQVLSYVTTAICRMACRQASAGMLVLGQRCSSQVGAPCMGSLSLFVVLCAQLQL
jgi:hypothetical protein